GHDILVGGAGNDTIRGGAGFDFIDGGAGNDQLFGEDGNDILRGGRGTDFLYGGQGDDSYVFNRGDGVDVRWSHRSLNRNRRAMARSRVRGSVWHRARGAAASMACHNKRFAQSASHSENAHSESSHAIRA
ncbi:MAG TPA: calcium-binding protein, partial [Bradyrhizobium sp.]|nr:calcium-binding protein [Bradyrhizobium sp.]